MARMTDEQLAALKPGEGSYALQDAAAAARRRRSQRGPGPVDHAALDRIIANAKAADRAGFDALIAAIDGAESKDIMKMIAIAAVRKAYPQYAEQEAA